jgi:hypothetical protein
MAEVFERLRYEKKGKYDIPKKATAKGFVF